MVVVVAVLVVMVVAVTAVTAVAVVAVPVVVVLAIAERAVEESREEDEVEVMPLGLYTPPLENVLFVLFMLALFVLNIPPPPPLLGDIPIPIGS